MVYNRIVSNLQGIKAAMHTGHGVPEGGQKQKKLLGYDTYIFWKIIP